MTAVIAAAAALLGSALGLAGALVTTNQQLAHDRQVRLREEVKTGCADLLRESRSMLSILAEAVGSTSPNVISDARTRAIAVQNVMLQAETALLLVAPADIVAKLTDPDAGKQKLSTSDALLDLARKAENPTSTEFRSALDSVKELQKAMGAEYIDIGGACRGYLTNN
ncbi:hypothetical protein ALI22I_00195, partial [Saccharothrix sp. ALI-22-I]|uniref:hypothetical protein n=1 Tax=Saccharothrix sp. ALI-22-I TaxID=1933778 RepID=UPI0009C6BC28